MDGINRMNDVLRDSSRVWAYVHPTEDESKFWEAMFSGTKENIASFIFRNRAAERILIYDRNGDMLVKCMKGSVCSGVNDEFRKSMNWYLARYAKDLAKLAIFDFYPFEDIKNGIFAEEPVTCFFRNASGDFTLWSSELPRCIYEQIMAIKPYRAGDMATLVNQIPDCFPCIDTSLYLIKAEESGFAMYHAPVNMDFFHTFRDEGFSVRGSVNYLLSDLHLSDLVVDITWNSLKQKTQSRLAEILGDTTELQKLSFARFSAPNFSQGLSVEWHTHKKKTLKI